MEENMSWGELALLTHKTQVEKFGWCSCEDNEGKENPYLDCTDNEQCIKCDMSYGIDNIIYAKQDGTLSSSEGDPYCEGCLPEQPEYNERGQGQ